jgi:hypothetical protein
MKLWEASYGNLAMYTVLIILAIVVWRIEAKDNKCPTPSSTPQECEDGGGMSFSFTKPLDSDTCQDLIRKIFKGAGAEQASIKWRRSFVISVVVMIAMWLLVGSPGGLPDWKVLYLSVVISYVILFATYNYYSYHVYGMAETWMKDALQKLQQKGCIKA